MRIISCRSAMTVVLALALFGWAGCGGQAESDETEGDGGAMQAEGINPAMGGEGEGMEDEGMEGEGGEEREAGEHAEGGEGDEGGEHAEEGEHSEGGEEGEESGEYIGRDANWDYTRRGIRLMLAYDAERNAFVGTIENTNEATACAVRVEVHLSNGTELGPTDRQDLGAGASGDVELPAQGEDFETWTAHPEVSACG